MEKSARYHCDLEATELRLGLPGSDVVEKAAATTAPSKINKRAFSDVASGVTNDGLQDEKESLAKESAPAAKAQVVGWPPIRSYRKNNLNVSSISKTKEAETSGMLVKVSMDGAPYLRKIDLKTYSDYQDLLKALEKMFSCFTMGEFASRDGSEMFISSCKKLRIMKGSEARGLSSGASHT
ncbi:hypothetical protein EJ110_NYTH43588 [Nymphaea thermarum]|nr:hypothetical protein EJ110_NYTH43588 [Nymphaea thermarum]